MCVTLLLGIYSPSNLFYSAAVPTITGMIVMTARTAMNAITERNVPITVEIAPGRLPVGQSLMIVALDHRLLGEIMMKEGLQGTMITDEGVLMTAEPLIIIMTDAGTIQTDAETTEDATKKTTLKTDLEGTRMEMEVGPAEKYEVFFLGAEREQNIMHGILTV
jgi:hypothetical protein